ncbi:MAG: GNAT family N-acetyltransferase [Planctomycetota bacterium]
MQTQGKISVRPAEPSDVPLLARIDQLATEPPTGRSFWDDVLAPIETPTLDFLEAMFRERAATWGAIEDFIVVETDGQPVAGCAVYRSDPDNPAYDPFDLNRLPLGWSDHQAEAFRVGYAKVWADVGDFLAPQAEWIVEAVAVLPEHQRQGHGRRLIEAAIAKARDAGGESLGVMVIHGNDPAAGLYEEFFNPWITYHAAYFGDGFPGLTKYRL